MWQEKPPSTIIVRLQLNFQIGTVEHRVSGQARVGAEVWEFAFFALKITPRIGAPFTQRGTPPRTFSLE